VTAIEAQDLTKTYGKGVRALDGLSFSASAGTVFALLGPNGAGKSTTIKILTTLSRPDSGRAQVAGIDVLADPARVRRAIGVVSQKPSFDPAATGRENLVLQGQIYDVTGRRLKQRVAHLLERFGLAEAANRAARHYSGGMQRRLDIALGLLHEPEVLFLDEPTTGLDPEARAEMWKEIARLTEQERLTILLTTHYLEEADELAAQLAIVDRGRIVAAGTPDELKSSLHGDSLQVELAAAPADGEVRRAIEAVPGLSEVEFDGRQVRARARDGATAMPSLMAALHESGLAVTKPSLSRPSLDDVYLRVAGRAFHEADANRIFEPGSTPARFEPSDHTRDS
jgi:ABC-2 type transport system ATP-binding protein